MGSAVGVERGENARLDSRENLSMNFFRRAQRKRRCVEAFNFFPVRLLSELVINARGSFEVSDISFEDVAVQFCVVAGALLSNHTMRLGRGGAQVEDEILDRQRIDAIFELLQPFEELGAFCWRNECGLMRQIRADGADGEDMEAWRKAYFRFMLTSTRSH